MKWLGACRKFHHKMLKLIFTVNIQSKGFILAFARARARAHPHKHTQFPFTSLLIPYSPLLLFPTLPKSSVLSLPCHLYSSTVAFTLCSHLRSLSPFVWSLFYIPDKHTQIQTQFLFMRENVWSLPCWFWFSLLNHNDLQFLNMSWFHFSSQYISLQ